MVSAEESTQIPDGKNSGEFEQQCRSVRGELHNGGDPDDLICTFQYWGDSQLLSIYSFWANLSIFLPRKKVTIHHSPFTIHHSPFKTQNLFKYCNNPFHGLISLLFRETLYGHNPGGSTSKMKFIKHLFVFFFCLFFSGVANVALETGLLPNERIRESSCCCSGVMETQCSCTGDCCDASTPEGVSISSLACGVSTAPAIQISEVKFVLSGLPAAGLFIHLYDYPEQTSSAILPDFYNRIDKPPRTLLAV